ncbi:hypothetical protein BJX64DRAFT_252150 [Aspergillus heterothallicus]
MEALAQVSGDREELRTSKGGDGSSVRAKLETTDPSLSMEDKDSGVGLDETPTEEAEEQQSAKETPEAGVQDDDKPIKLIADEAKAGHPKASAEEEANPSKAADTTDKSKSSLDTLKKQTEHIIFQDPLGTRWIFPFEKAKTWSGAKELIKLVYSDNYISDRYADILDKEHEGPHGSFSIIALEPEDTYIVSQMWESVVRPGWEFKISLEGSWYIPDEVREAKKNATSDTNAEDEKTNGDDGPKISYVAKYLVPDDDGDLMYHSEKQLTEKITSKNISNTEKKGTVLEEHREISCHGKSPKDPVENRIDSIGVPVIYIRSQILHNALKAVISFQSRPDMYVSKWRRREITSSLEQGRFIYPFTDLWHYRHKLLDYRDQVKEGHDPEYSETCRGAIDFMLDYLQDEPPIPVSETELMWRYSSPKTKFSSLWLLLRPGSDVYVREQGQLNAYVVEGFTGGPQWTMPEARILEYEVHVWNLNFDGLVLTRSAKTVAIPVFDGEREIASLPVFPTEFHVDEDPEKSLRQRLIDRGKSFVEMVRKPTFREYTGPSRLQGIREFTRARVVIDHTSRPWWLQNVAKNFKGDKEPPLPVQTIADVELGERTRVPSCPCESCHAKETQEHSIQRRKFDDYDDIDLNASTSLTDHQYMLCWSHVYAFVLKDRVWDLLDVSFMELPRIQKNIIDLLVMKPEGNKHMIKAICEIYGGTYTQNFTPDFISGKGEGQIILLHGPPGTGKTLTAESVAEYSSRPLLSITSADLGQEPDALEQNLLRFFRDAKKWNAIVLLDEADVYLETRSSQDLRRNSIVSIFLRALDYFQGILFLTTNRVGSFDEAFLSRIHVQIGYDPLDEGSRQQIWDNHFKKLSRNRDLNGQEIRCSYDAKEFVRKSKELQKLKWNGREIRNAFQTAVALACYQAKQEGNDVPELTDEHLRQVVDMSQNFKTYLHNVRGAEEEMAYAARLRNDEVKASGKDT